MVTRVVRTVIVAVFGCVMLWHAGGCDLLEATVCQCPPCECAEVSDWQELVGDIEDLVASIDE